MYPSVYARARAVRSDGAPIWLETVPSAFAVGPWQTLQKFWYSVSPAASISRGMMGIPGPGRLAFPLPPANGLRTALTLAAFPETHSADQSGSPPVTGTVPGGVFRGTFCVS